MNIYQLQYFLAVASEENITQAAKKMNISQQALSSVISTIEKDMDSPLFDRVCRKIMLNDAGRIVQEHGVKMLQEYQEMLRHLEELKDTYDISLRVASVALNVCRKVMQAFSRNYDASQLVTNRCSSSEIVQLLKDNEYDFILANEPCDNPHISSRLIVRDPFYLVLADTHPLANCQSISLSQLKNEKFVTGPNNSRFFHVLHSLCEQAGYEPTISLMSHSDEMLIDYVIHEHAVHIRAASSLDAHAVKNANLRFIPITDENAYRNIYLLWNKSTAIKGIKKKFFNYVITEGSRLILENHED